MFSTAQNTQRSSQSYIEKRRGREEIEMTLGRKRGIKRRETDPASNQFPKCSPQSRHTKRLTELGREEKGEGGNRGNLGEEGRV